MTWWMTLLIALIPALGLNIPTILLLRTARRKAVKDIEKADADTSLTYSEAAKNMAEQNRELMIQNKELREQNNTLTLERQDLTKYKATFDLRLHELEEQVKELMMEAGELKRGIGILCDQMAKHDPPIIPDWTYDKRVFGKLAKPK